MAQDCIRLLQRPGFTGFDVAGHDRGGRVAYRMALDAPQAVRRLDNGSSSVVRHRRRSIPKVAWPGHESVDSFRPWPEAGQPAGE
jgi:pimeloyl-ACP methyl ester carboxylesterase